MRTFLLLSLLLSALPIEQAQAGAVTFAPRPPQRQWTDLTCDELREIIADGSFAAEELEKFDLKAVPNTLGLYVMKLMRAQELGDLAERARQARADCN